MGMTTSVIGIKPPDEKWKKMKAVWDACAIAKVDPPDEVEMFFNGDKPDNAGVLVYKEKLGDAVVPYSDNYRSGYEIHLDKLPKDVKIIRFTNSW